MGGRRRGPALQRRSALQDRFRIRRGALWGGGDVAARQQVLAALDIRVTVTGWTACEGPRHGQPCLGAGSGGAALSATACAGKPGGSQRDRASSPATAGKPSRGPYGWSVDSIVGGPWGCAVLPVGCYEGRAPSRRRAHLPRPPNRPVTGVPYDVRQTSARRLYNGPAAASRTRGWVRRSPRSPRTPHGPQASARSPLRRKRAVTNFFLPDTLVGGLHPVSGDRRLPLCPWLGPIRYLPGPFCV